MEPTVIATLKSLNTSLHPDFQISDQISQIIIGRHDTCHIKLIDRRCSTFHCLIKVNSAQHSFSIEDTSSNGTYLNGIPVITNQIGKNNVKNLQVDDQLYMLSKTAVRAQEFIGFKLIQTNTKRASTAPEEPSKEKSSKTDDRLSEEISCLICLDIVHQAVALIPCLHNFCGGCFSDWSKRSKECPQCRTAATSVKKNHLINNLAQIFLKEHPDQKRPDTELKSLTEMNIFTSDITDLREEQKKVQEKKQEVKAPPVFQPLQPLFGQQAQFIPMNNNLFIQNPVVKCRQCNRKNQGYKCVLGQVHANCVKCNQAMPVRNLPGQQCEVCRRYFCNLYWNRNPKCRIGLLRLDQYIASTFTNIHPNSFNENKFQQTVLLDYIRNNRIAMNAVANHLINKMEKEKWILNLQGTRVGLNRGSNICVECSVVVWNQLLYHYRQEIGNNLPRNIRDRPNCWHGKECRTQSHNITHSQKLNHICEKDPSK